MTYIHKKIHPTIEDLVFWKNRHNAQTTLARSNSQVEALTVREAPNGVDITAFSKFSEIATALLEKTQTSPPTSLRGKQAVAVMTEGIFCLSHAMLAALVLYIKYSDNPTDTQTVLAIILPIIATGLSAATGGKLSANSIMDKFNELGQRDGLSAALSLIAPEIQLQTNPNTKPILKTGPLNSTLGNGMREIARLTNPENINDQSLDNEARLKAVYKQLHQKCENCTGTWTTIKEWCSYLFTAISCLALFAEGGEAAYVQLYETDQITPGVVIGILLVIGIATAIFGSVAKYSAYSDRNTAGQTQATTALARYAHPEAYAQAIQEVDQEKATAETWRDRLPCFGNKKEQDQELDNKV